MPLRNDRIVLITGANRGLGRAILRRFGAAGDRCIATVRGEESARALRAELAGETRSSVAICDVRDTASVAALAELVREAPGRVDVLINNAAVFEQADRELSADALDIELVRRTFETNVLGTIAVSVALLPLMPRGARIVNVSSELGQLEKPGGITPTMTAYALSKTAVNAYTSSLANALCEREIRVDSLHPGWLRTAMGGPEAPLAPADGAEAVFALAARTHGETGRFWIDGRPAAW